MEAKILEAFFLAVIAAVLIGMVIVLGIKIIEELLK